MIAAGEIVGLAEWIIDDTCLASYIMQQTIEEYKRNGAERSNVQFV